MAKRKVDPMRAHELATQFLHKLNHSEDSPRLHHWAGEWWEYHETRWRRVPEPELLASILAWMIDEEITAKKVEAQCVLDVLQAITLSREVRTMPFWSPPILAEEDGPWLNMENWLVNPERLASGDREGGVQQKTSRWFSTVEVPYDYDPEATCPTWDKWCEDMLPSPEARDLIEEFFGYLLIPETLQHAALFLVGDGGTGKSTVSVVAEALLGSENCSSLSIQQLASEYGLNTTFGKMLNYIDETSHQISAKEEMALKWYISGRPLETNRKYLGYLKMRPTARLIVATNRFPEFKDPTDGIWRRIHSVKMDRKLGVDERDPRILATLQGEAPGIFNRALLGLHRLREQGRFTVVENAALDAARDSLQSVKSFIEDYLCEKEDGFLCNGTIKDLYGSWCMANGTKPSSTIIELSQSIMSKWPNVKRESRRIDATTKRGLQGIALVE